MRVRTSKSKLGLRFYIIKTYYDTKGIEHTVTVEKLGSEHEIREKPVGIRWNGQKRELPF